jgi:hypothetical protein
MADVVIDGALPRTDRERGETLVTYLDIHDASKAKRAYLTLDEAISTDSYNDWENDTCQMIAEAVGTYAPQLIHGAALAQVFQPGKVVIGVHCPGDVVVYWPGDEDMPSDDEEL